MTSLAWIASQACAATADCLHKSFYACAACEAPICRSHEVSGLCPECLLKQEQCRVCGAVIDQEIDEYGDGWCSQQCVEDYAAEWKQEERP